jgi:16S rRNA (uracil1498-N3)-methyltransferase
MTRRLWIADRIAGGRAYLTGDHALHLARVLRARKGQQFDIAAEGVARIGTILSISDDQVEFELGEAAEDRSLPEVNVVISIYKFDRLEWAIEKLTELGVCRILPVIARRTEPHLAKAAGKRVERWRRIAHEAAQQSRRIVAPEIASPATLASMIQSITGSRIVLSELEEKVSVKMALAESPAPVTLALGPEGGWTTEEAEAFDRAGWKSASLGNTILRAETAAIAAVAIVMAERAVSK